jgi:superfamily II DNA or RNA helicase
MVLLSKGVNELIANGGRIQIITSPNLSPGDIEIIQSGYQERARIISRAMLKSIDEEEVTVSIDDIQDVVNMIAYDKFELKIAIRSNGGLFHDKMGLFHDKMGNRICFVGSLNETRNAYVNNYEKIRVFRDWASSDEEERVNNEHGDFMDIWNGNNEGVETYTVDEAIKHKIIEKVKHGAINGDAVVATGDKLPITLRPYQQQAVQSFADNGFVGFFEMATGTGKTWTAIASAKLLMSKKPVAVLVIAPYIHLIEQWAQDIEKVMKGHHIVRVYSDNKKWERDLRAIINLSRPEDKKRLIILATQKAFSMQRLRKVIQRIQDDVLLIVDEAHRFVNLIPNLLSDFKYRLGLSATPHFINDPQKSERLIRFFDKIVFKFPLEDAIGKYLVNYEYYPFFVHLTAEEEALFTKAQSRIASCFKEGKLIKSPEELGKAIRFRNSIIAQSREKDAIAFDLVTSLPSQKHLVVYCGDGFTRSEEGNSDVRYVDKITRGLADRSLQVHKFTASESLEERIELIEDFDKGTVDIMVAIRCLDEGIDIPSIESALILASNNDMKEFIQRRGRILRMHKGKEKANIYDVIVLPHSIDNDSLALIELKRFYEFSRLAQNHSNLIEKLDELCQTYRIDPMSLRTYEQFDEIERDDNDE